MFDHTTQLRTPDHRPSNWTNWIICQRWWWWRCTYNAPSWPLCAEWVGCSRVLPMCIILSSILLLFYCNVCWLHICSRLNRKKLYTGDNSRRCSRNWLNIVSKCQCTKSDTFLLHTAITTRWKRYLLRFVWWCVCVYDRVKCYLFVPQQNVVRNCGVGQRI